MSKLNSTISKTQETISVSNLYIFPHSHSLSEVPQFLLYLKINEIEFHDPRNLINNIHLVPIHFLYFQHSGPKRSNFHGAGNRIKKRYWFVTYFYTPYGALIFTEAENQYQKKNFTTSKTQDRIFLWNFRIFSISPRSTPRNLNFYGTCKLMSKLNFTKPRSDIYFEHIHFLLLPATLHPHPRCLIIFMVAENQRWNRITQSREPKKIYSWCT